MHKFLQKYLFVIIFVIFILCIFRAWFSFGTIAGGDLDYFWDYNFFTLHPYAWNFPKGDGLGVFYVPFLWVYMVQSVPIFLFGHLLQLPWDILERVIFFYPFLICTATTPIIMYRKFIAKNGFYYFAAIIYVANTYILNIVQGGQMIFALAYSLVPLTIVLFIDLISSVGTLKKSIIVGLILALQLLLDIRVAYIVLIAVAIYFCIFTIISKSKLRDILYTILFVFIIPGSITLLLHAFWLLPILFYHNNPVQQLGSAYNSLQSVKFFSFAKFENVFGLLHPNWPENIFGKVYFMRPEFLLLPILAYAGLLFLQKTSDKKEKKRQIIILFFALMGLLGIFLGKGSQDPFGSLYLWMFSHIPGFVMFRDPTKWYILVILSYSILIPFTISSLYHWFTIQTKRKSIPNIFILCIVFYFLFLIRSAIFGQLGGTFAPHIVAESYSTLEKYLANQKGFSRTLWLPVTTQYGYVSADHPAISASTFFNIADNKKLLQKFSQNTTQSLLQEGSIQYVIVPFDSEGTIFVKDHHFDNNTYQQYLISLRKLSWLQEVHGFGSIHVFSINNQKDHFWSSSQNMHISYTFKNPTSYVLSINNAQQGASVIFSEKYDPYWRLIINGQSIKPRQYHTYFMSFDLPQGGNMEGEVIYTIQKYVDLGRFISVGIFVVSLLFFCWSFLRRK